ncbi:hypothetical protein GVAV_001786 [Gurleya vavrai]
MVTKKYKCKKEKKGDFEKIHKMIVEEMRKESCGIVNNSLGNKNNNVFEKYIGLDKNLVNKFEKNILYEDNVNQIDNLNNSSLTNNKEFFINKNYDEIRNCAVDENYKNNGICKNLNTNILKNKNEALIPKSKVIEIKIKNNASLPQKNIFENSTVNDFKSNNKTISQKSIDENININDNKQQHLSINGNITENNEINLNSTENKDLNNC